METIEIKTLIDITNTRVTRLNQGTQYQIDQQRNFITLAQCIELRSIVHFEHPPTCEVVHMMHHDFGSSYRAHHAVWTFRFIPDRDGVYLDENGDRLGFLREDLHQVPIILKLGETVNTSKAMFDLKDPLLKNTMITLIR